MPINGITSTLPDTLYIRELESVIRDLQVQVQVMQGNQRA